MSRRRSNPGSYLEWHGRNLRVVVRVPRGLIAAIGRTTLKESLNTDSVAAANTLKWLVIARLQGRIAQARSLDRVPGTTAQLKEALRFRELAGIVDRTPATPVCQEGCVDIRAAEIAKEHGDGAAKAFHDIATGTVTPITPLLDPWLDEINAAPRTRAVYRRAIRRFTEWGIDNHRAIHVEAVSRRLAGDYVSSVLAAIVRASANRELSALNSFWVWLEKRGYVTGESPWSRQRFDTQGRNRSETKRPFTDPEVARLLGGIDAQPMSDMCRVAALTGMRVSEIAELLVGDLTEGAIIVRKGKTPAAARIIPIHPDIAAILRRRTDGKAPATYVFHELPTQKSIERSRAAPVCQAFTRARRKLGVDVRAEGVRQSAIDFHSFRRWFDRKALDAFERGARGFTPWTIAEVMGHSVKDMPLPMTMGLYPGPSSMEAKRACVEAVRLPGDIVTGAGPARAAVRPAPDNPPRVSAGEVPAASRSIQDALPRPAH